MLAAAEDLSGVYSLLAGVSGALIVVIIAIGIALARTRESVAKLTGIVEENQRRLNKIEEKEVKS